MADTFVVFRPPSRLGAQAPPRAGHRQAEGQLETAGPRGDAQHRSGRAPIDQPRRLAAGNRDGLQQFLMPVPPAAVALQIPVDLLAAQRASPDVLPWDFDAAVVGFRPVTGADAEPHDRRGHQHNQAAPDDPGQSAIGGQCVDERPQRDERQQ
jgi:hypothetical protein